jgi:hypothetical protein
MRVSDGTRKILALSEHFHIAESAQRLDEIVRALVPAHSFQPIRHALCGFDEQRPPLRSIELGGPEIRESRGLESMALPNLERDFK